MWLYLSLFSAIFTGFSTIVIKKCSKDNLAIRRSLLGLLIGNIAYVILGACATDVIQNFNIGNLVKIAPLSIIQTIGYVCAILSVKYARVSTVSPIRKVNTVITLLLGVVIFNDTGSIYMCFNFSINKIKIIREENHIKNDKNTGNKKIYIKKL